MRGTFPLRPIGVVRSAIAKPEEAPGQRTQSGTEAGSVIHPACAEGLDGLGHKVARHDHAVPGNPREPETSEHLLGT